MFPLMLMESGHIALKGNSIVMELILKPNNGSSMNPTTPTVRDVMFL
jgi:hypothetical protein